MRHQPALLRLGQAPDGLRARQAALVEDRLRGDHAQLLADERHGDRQQRVEIEEVVARVVSRRRQRAGREHEGQRRALPDAQQHPERARPAHAGLPHVPQPATERGGGPVEPGSGQRGCHDRRRHAR